MIYLHLLSGSHKPLNLELEHKNPPGLLSNQGEKSINLYFIRVLLRKKVLKYGTPKPSMYPYREYFKANVYTI